MSVQSISAAQPAALPRFLTFAEVAKAIGITRQATYAAIERGSLPKPIKFGPHAVRFVESEVLEAIERLKASRS